MTTKHDLERINGLGKEETVEVLNPQGTFPGIILCDHASSTVPPEYENLGLADADLDKHIGVDIGIAEVVRAVAHRLNAPAVMTRYSRLLLDCNRWIADPRLIMAESDGVTVPGNKNLGEPERQRRLDTYFWPYHAAINSVVAHHAAREPFAFIVSLHSCTRQLGSEFRDWDAGTIWHEGDSLSRALLAALGDRGDLRLGDNAPYSGIGGSFTIDYHSWGTGIPTCGLEIVNDHLVSSEGQANWSERLIDALSGLAAQRETIWKRHNSTSAAEPRLVFGIRS
jgi:predicted N-formylglutamate amidohydrolase